MSIIYTHRIQYIKEVYKETVKKEGKIKKKIGNKPTS